MASKSIVAALFFVALSSFVAIATAQCNLGTNPYVAYDNSLGGSNTGTSSCTTTNPDVSAGPPAQLANTKTCYFACVAGRSNSGTTDDILFDCPLATGVDPSSMGTCSSPVCDNNTPTLPTGVTIGSCTPGTRATPLPSCTTAATSAGYADFAGGVNAGSTTTTITCSSTTPNTYTAANVAAACDTVPTTIGSLTAAAGAWTATGGTCANVAAAPRKAASSGGGTCTIVPNTPYFSFGSTGSAPFGTSISSTVSVGCTAQNTYTLSAADTWYKACSAPVTSSTVTAAFSTKVDTAASTTSTECNYASTSNAIKENAACNLKLAASTYDFTSGNNNPPTFIAATCSDATTNTYAANNPSATVDIGCVSYPTSLANTGYAGANGNRITIPTGSTGTTGYCSELSISNVLQKGSSCKMALDTANRYFDMSAPASPKSTIDLNCNAAGNVFTPAASPSIAQACVAPTFASPVSHVAVGGCTGTIADGATCVATCDASSTIDATQSGSPSTYFTYSCTASSNTLTISGSNAAPLCNPIGCTAPPTVSAADAVMYDFTAGSTPCGSVDATTHKVLTGNTCTLACKPGYYAKNNVAPTFTCNPTSQTLVPTNVDICVPISQLPITIFAFGTKV